MYTAKFFIIAAILGAMLTSCRDEDESVQIISITLNATETVIHFGGSEQLSVTGVLPANATEKGIIWSSDNTDRATVDAGMVTVPATASAGTVNITATAKDGSGVTATCVVTVNLTGKVSFKTSQIWTIPAANGAPKQEWSDVVMASGAKKDNYNCKVADCRQNPPYGDLFSWHTVVTYENQLCPTGWRVPTKDDFINLDKALGGTGRNNTPQFVTEKFINTWGGAFGGYCYCSNTMEDQGSGAYYWSDTDYNDANAINFSFNTSGTIQLQSFSGKSFGFMLRCVR